MNKEWIAAKEAEYTVMAKDMRAKIVSKINNAEFLTEEDKRSLEKALDEECDKPYCSLEASALTVILKNHSKENDKFATSIADIHNLIDSLDAHKYNSIVHMANGGLKRYLDSEPMEFDGDIIITDPCYIMRAEHHGTIPITDDDWDACGYGENMEVFGIQNYMTRDTIYGDWGCDVYNTDTKEKIGEFCADAGLVSVLLLDEVLKYNPDFDYHKKKSWTTTWIQDFKGTVQFVVELEEGVYEDDSEFWKAGDKWEEYSVHVIGCGINKKTGKPINFRSTQMRL